MKGQPDASAGVTGHPVETKAGYVTLVGRPNAGKSTLLNALVGEKLSIVTAKAQTTWQRVTAIASGDDVQMIFLDTPGLLQARDMLQRSMHAAAMEALAEADVVLLVMDATRGLDASDLEVLETTLPRSSAPRIAAINKADLATPESIESCATWASDSLGATTHVISALHGTGVRELRTEVSKKLPPGPFLYPPDDLASQPLRFFVEELIRETVFEQFRQEIPYSVVTRVEEYREAQEPIYIGASIFVERNSQKGILVGKGGEAIRKLGQEARGKIEALVGEPVYLDLWVKVLDDWRRKRAHLERLGFRVPDDDESSRD